MDTTIRNFLNKGYKNLSLSVIKTCHQINDHGGKAFIVGGWVRDCLLGLQSYDIDLEVYQLSYDELKILFNERIIGQYPKFGILKLEDHIDISIPRQEECIGKRYNDFHITLCPNFDFKTSAKRRDFTINAMGFSPLTSDFLDPFNGYNDLAKKQLKPISHHFVEDSYRVLRAVQLIARFGFSATHELLELAQKMSPESLSKDHIKRTQNCMQLSPNLPKCIHFLEQINWPRELYENFL